MAYTVIDIDKSKALGGHDAPPRYTEKAYEGTLPVGYVSVSAAPDGAVLLRSDGAIDYTSRGGRVSKRISPPPGAPGFTAISYDLHALYALRADGTILRCSAGWGAPRTGESPRDERRPPAGERYTAVSSGPHASYFVRSDGLADRATAGGKVTSTLTPKGHPAVCYTAASAGLDASLLLRSDGAIDVVKGGTVVNTLVSAAGYTAVSEQVTNHNDKSEWGVRQVYCLRGDGAADRFKVGALGHLASTAQEMRPPMGGRLVAAGAGCSQSYLLSAAGDAERIKGGTVVKTLPGGGAGGWRYTQASCGQSASYLLRSDGQVDRVQSGKVRQTMAPQSEVAHQSCTLQ